MTIAVTNHSRCTRGGRHRSTRPRTLNLIDLEDLVGGHVTGPVVREMWTEFVDVVGPRFGDHSIVAVSRRHAAAAFFALPNGIRRVIATNARDGARLALIDSVDVEWAAARFGQVVIASGDHIVAPMAMRLQQSGLRVIQVIGAGASSAELYRVCADHKFLAQTRATMIDRRRWRLAPTG